MKVCESHETGREAGRGALKDVARDKSPLAETKMRNMINLLKVCTLRLLQCCVSIVIGFWLPQELFVFSKLKAINTKIGYLKRVCFVLFISIVVTFFSIYMAIYISFQSHNLLNNLIVTLLKIVAIMLCIVQMARYFVRYKILIGIICIIPIIVSFFIIYKPYGFEKFKGNIYMKFGYSLVWPLIEGEFIKKIQNINNDKTKDGLAILNDFALDDCVTRTLVYDESDEIANPKGLRLNYWLYRNRDLVRYWKNGEPVLSYNEEYADKHLIITMFKLRVEKVKGHFYIVYENICNTRGYEIQIDKDNYSIIKGGCSMIETPVRHSCPDQWE